MPAEVSSSQLREQGNAFYKEGKFLDAIESYTKAAEADPKDGAPLGNLSAAYFEAGRYEDSIQASRRGIELSEDNADRREKLAIRAAHCHLYLKQNALAEECLATLSTTAAVSLRDTISARRSSLPDGNESNARFKVVGLPRYKPSLVSVAEYFPVGHDQAESLFKPSMIKGASVAYMLAGVGDARHLFATLIDIVHQEKRQNVTPVKHHFSIVDLKSTAIARDLVVFLLLDALALIETTDGAHPDTERAEVLTTLYFVYVAAIMPQVCYDRLQRTIAMAITALEHGNGLLTSWLYVPVNGRKAIVSSLKSWQRLVPSKYDVIRVRRGHLEQIKATPSDFEDCPVPFAEKSAFAQVAMLFPPTNHEEPAVQHIIRAFVASRGGRQEISKLTRYVEGHWKPNVTLIDLEWERAASERDRTEHELFLDYNSLNFPNSLPGGERTGRPKSLYSFVQSFFADTARALTGLKGRCTVEAIVGEIGQTLEEIRYGLLDCRTQEPITDTHPTDTHQSDYPQLYERIHLSNIPDYIGGTLASFIWATPVTVPGPESYITSCNLRNPGSFNSFNAFNNEYARVNDAESLEKLFQVRRGDLEMSPEISPTMSYVNWHRSADTVRPLDQILSKIKTECWLFGMFFSLSIPVERDPRNFLNLVNSPLNMTMFFRLLEHLHETGYPAHWLSDVLGRLLSGSITTSSRPPRSDPLSIKEIRRPLPPTKQTITPFLAELSTLTAIWEPLLPFGIANIGDLPTPSTINRFSVTMRDNNLDSSNMNTFVLFFCKEHLPVAGFPQFRQYLVDDETKCNNANGDAVHARGLHIVSTWEWSAKYRRATFWMRRDFIERLKREQGWVVGILRTDMWMVQQVPESVCKIEDGGMTWADYVEGWEDVG